MSKYSPREVKKIHEFINLSEKLKDEMRHSWTSLGRQESVAEHSWRVSLLAMLLQPYIQIKLDLEKVLKISIIHDLVEVFSGDLSYHQMNPSELKRKRKEEEHASIRKLKIMLPEKLANQLEELWLEFEEQRSAEGKFVMAIDRLEVCIQHSEADISTWLESEQKSCTPFANYLKNTASFDPVLKAYTDLVLRDIKEKISNQL